MALSAEVPFFRRRRAWRREFRTIIEINGATEGRVCLTFSLHKILGTTPFRRHGLIPRFLEGYPLPPTSTELWRVSFNFFVFIDH